MESAPDVLHVARGLTEAWCRQVLGHWKLRYTEGIDRAAPLGEEPTGDTHDVGEESSGSTAEFAVVSADGASLVFTGAPGGGHGDVACPSENLPEDFSGGRSPEIRTKGGFEEQGGIQDRGARSRGNTKTPETDFHRTP